MLNEYAQLLLCLQRPKEAERWAREAIVDAEGFLHGYPHFRWGIHARARANRVLSDALLCLGRYEEAEKAGRWAIQGQERLVESAPNLAVHKIALAWSQYRLGERLWWIGRPEEAEALFQEVRLRLERTLVQHPDESEVGRCLARILVVCPAAHLRDPDWGRELSLAREQPEIGATRQLLAAAYYRDGKWQQAITALTECNQLNQGGDAVDWVFLAMAHWQLEQQAKAIHWYHLARDAFDRKSPLGLQNFSHPFHLSDLLEEAEALIGIERETRMDTRRQLPTVRRR